MADFSHGAASLSRMEERVDPTSKSRDIFRYDNGVTTVVASQIVRTMLLRTIEERVAKFKEGWKLDRKPKRNECPVCGMETYRLVDDHCFLCRSAVRKIKNP